jgi:hypothetical protein
MTDGPVDSLRKLEADDPSLVRFLAPASEELIRAAEERLGLRFPPDYRAFLAACGAAQLGTREIYGLGDSLDTIDGLNVVWHTEQARQYRDLPPSNIVLSSWDDQTLEIARVVDETGAPVDGPVVELLVEGRGEWLGGSFDEWLQRTIAEVREDAAS